MENKAITLTITEFALYLLSNFNDMNAYKTDPPTVRVPMAISRRDLSNRIAARLKSDETLIYFCSKEQRKREKDAANLVDKTSNPSAPEGQLRPPVNAGTAMRVPISYSSRESVDLFGKENGGTDRSSQEGQQRSLFSKDVTMLDTRKPSWEHIEYADEQPQHRFGNRRQVSEDIYRGSYNYSTDKAKLVPNDSIVFPASTSAASTHSTTTDEVPNPPNDDHNKDSRVTSGQSQRCGLICTCTEYPSQCPPQVYSPTQALASALTYEHDNDADESGKKSEGEHEDRHEGERNDKDEEWRRGKYQRGYDDGFKEGVDDGYNEGYEAGYELACEEESEDESDGEGEDDGEGQDEGKDEGKDEGEDDVGDACDRGYDDGWEDGYDKGYDKGYDEGYDEGYDKGYYETGEDDEFYSSSEELQMIEDKDLAPSEASKSSDDLQVVGAQDWSGVYEARNDDKGAPKISEAPLASTIDGQADGPSPFTNGWTSEASVASIASVEDDRLEETLEALQPEEEEEEEKEKTKAAEKRLFQCWERDGGHLNEMWTAPENAVSKEAKSEEREEHLFRRAIKYGGCRPVSYLAGCQSETRAALLELRSLHPTQLRMPEVLSQIEHLEEELVRLKNIEVICERVEEDSLADHESWSSFQGPFEVSKPDFGLANPRYVRLCEEGIAALKAQTDERIKSVRERGACEQTQAQATQQQYEVLKKRRWTGWGKEDKKLQAEAEWKQKEEKEKERLGQAKKELWQRVKERLEQEAREESWAFGMKESRPFQPPSSPARTSSSSRSPSLPPNISPPPRSVDSLSPGAARPPTSPSESPPWFAAQLSERVSQMRQIDQYNYRETQRRAEETAEKKKKEEEEEQREREKEKAEMKVEEYEDMWASFAMDCARPSQPWLFSSASPPYVPSPPFPYTPAPPQTVGLSPPGLAPNPPPYNGPYAIPPAPRSGIYPGVGLLSAWSSAPQPPRPVSTEERPTVQRVWAEKFREANQAVEREEEKQREREEARWQEQFEERCRKEYAEEGLVVPTVNPELWGVKW